MNNENKDIYYYQPAALNKLTSELTKAFETMEADGNRYIKSATVNTILVVNADYNKEEIEDLIYTLTLVHPNRAFIIVLDESLTEIKSDFSTRCHKISKNEHICSEVIRLFTNSKNLSALRSVLRGNLVTGVHTELVLYKGADPQQACEEFGMLSEQIIFSSSIYQNKLTDLKSLLRYDSALIDLNWVKLSSWREQVKDIFNNVVAREKLSELKKIQLTYSTDKCQALLLAGWLVNRLGMVMESKTGDKYTFRSKEINNLTLELQEKSDAREGVFQLNFSFENKAEYIKITRGNLLTSEINFKEQIRATRPMEDADFIDLLKRYFFIGESIINYKDSLQNALKLLG